MTAAVCYIGYDNLALYWRQISEAYEEFPALGEYFELQELRELLFNPFSGYGLWVCTDHNRIEGLMVTALVQYPKRTDVHITVASCKHMSKYLKIGLTNVERWAHTLGATYVTFDGRLGLERLSKPLGYKPQTRMRKNVRIAWGH